MSYDKFLASDEIISLRAKFSDGTEADTHWKKCRHTEVERFRFAEGSGDLAQVERAKQKLIAASLVNPDGSRAITEADSLKLTAEGVNILFPLALQASGIAKRPDPGNAGGEAPSTTSSASSP